MESKCLFCKWKELARSVYENESFYSVPDENPVNNGHCLIISKKHISSFTELNEKESIDLIDAIKKTKEIINEKYNPEGYNIGINEGGAAGQTIFHLHIHLIPRYMGDVSNPIGGVRNIIPGKGDYTKK